MSVTVLGWLATGAFTASYLFRKPATLRKVQACAACLWILYGIAIGAMPVIIANVIVAAAALYSSLRGQRNGTDQQALDADRQSMLAYASVIEGGRKSRSLD